MKFAAVDQITPANVAQLREAWSYTPGGVSPLVINNVMYFFAGGNVIALNPENGTEIWKFELARATPEWKQESARRRPARAARNRSGSPGKLAYCSRNRP